MSPRNKIAEVVSAPQEKGSQVMGTWLPVTPEKPIPTRSNPVVVDRYGRPVARENWQELGGYSVGNIQEMPNYSRGIHHMQEMPNYNGVVHHLNPIGQVGRNEGYYGGHDIVAAERSEMINQIAASFRQASAGWNTSTVADLLAIKKAAANRTQSRGTNMANKTITTGSQIDNWTDCNLSNLPVHNQAHCFVSNPLRNRGSFQQIPQYEFPVAYWSNYTINSPSTSARAASGITTTLPFPPGTPDHHQLTKLENNQLSKRVNISMDESSNLGKDEQEIIVVPNGNKAAQINFDEFFRKDESSSVISKILEEQKDFDNRNDKGIDLNKTPQQKPPKRKKHRPKVYVEGKTKNTGKKKPGEKRKYVRKKGMKESATDQAEVIKETTEPRVGPDLNPSAGPAARSCRRALNFDFEKTREESQSEVSEQQDVQQGHQRTFNLNLDSQATELTSRTSSGCGTESTLVFSHQNSVPTLNQQPGNVSTHTLSMTQILAGYISMPERHAAAPSSLPRKDLHVQNLKVIANNADTRIVDPCTTSSKNGYSPIQQHPYAKADFENVEKTRVIFSNAPLSKILSSSKEGRGSKREYCHAIEQTNPHITNSMCSSLLCQDLSQMDGCQRNSNIMGASCSETHKKKKFENGLQTNIIGSPFGMHAIKDCSRQVQTKYTNGINGTGFTTQTNYGVLNSHSESTNIAKIGDSGVVTELSSNWHAQYMTSGCNLPKHIHSEQHLHKAKLREINRLVSVPDFAPSTASEKSNLLPPTPPGGAPGPGDRLATQTHCSNDLAKQNLNHNLANPASSRTDQMMPEHKDVFHDHLQFSAKTKGPPNKQIYPIPMDEIIHKFKGLNLNGTSNHVQEQEQNAIVLYKQDGIIVPYEGFEFIKKRKPRPKVDLDPETNRIWNLLMGKEGSEGLEGMDKEKEKWWEEERRIFQGRADSFIARMHLVQGDRRFSKWKGSVVDSVIGVFLTQNVSDHLSSSAFMSLASRFPLKLNNRIHDIDGATILVEEPEECALSPNHIQRNEKISRHPLCSQSSMTPHELTECQRESEISGIGKTSLLEAHSQSLEEEVISSQDSFSSSIFQGSGGIKSYSGSNSELEDPTSGCKITQDHRSANFVQVGNSSLFQDFYSCINVNPIFQEDYRNGQKLSNDRENSQQESRLDSIENFGSSLTFTELLNFNSPQNQVPLVSSSNYETHITSYLELLEGPEMCSGECISSWPSTASWFSEVKDADYTSRRNTQQAEDVGETTVQQNGLSMPEGMPTVKLHALSSNQSIPQQNVSQPESLSIYNQQYSESTSFTEAGSLAEAPVKGQNSTIEHALNCIEVTEKAFDVEERISAVNKVTGNKSVEPNSREQVLSTHKLYGEANPTISKSRKGKADSEKKNATDWDILRKQAQSNGRKKESKDTMDSLDYEAIRCASVKEISDAIKERGMNNMLAERIKEFLNRLVQDHGSIDLEWLRDVPPDKAKDYLLSIRGLGLKSVECVRLLTLHHLAFPVDTNVGRIAVRLGWVPLQPLPESLQLHLLELYPILESIQKYLWPRLCKLDQRTLYELHYQLITFGKVFCTKSKPNCNACPMRGECRHFASAFASARLALPGPDEKGIVSSTVPTTAQRNPAPIINPVPLPPPGENSIREVGHDIGKCEPIIEEPATPEQECTEISGSDIEDTFYEDPDEIPTIKLNIEEFTVNLQNYMQENMELQEVDMSKALVALNPEAASIPAPRLKNVSRLRTEHQVYELPDSHPLLEGMDRREPDDPSPYLLAIWTPGETANSIQPPEKSCGSQESGKLCNEKTCFSCNSVREANSQTVRGTLLIPCRTAMRGSFPLNGTYFQVNEMFADHESSLNPINVPREWIWNLPRRTVYFGTSVSTIFKGLSTEGIQYCFWKGFVCVRGFDQKTRAPRPLMARLHFPASKLAKTKNKNKR